MPLGLKRYRHEGDDHFITFSCYRREAYFTTTPLKTSSSTPWNSPANATGSKSSATSSCPSTFISFSANPSTTKSPSPKHSSPSSCPSQSASRRNPSGKPATTRFFVLHPQQASRKAEVHAPQPSHPKPRRKAEDGPWFTYRHYLLDEPGPVRISPI
jgi:putative transposase